MSLVLHHLLLRGHPELNLIGFDLAQLIIEVRCDFSELDSHKIEVWLQRQPTLACVTHDETKACIQLHSILNHPQTPRRVVAFILRHELLHLLIPPREVDGVLKSHPPEFWEAESKLAPDRVLMWAWLKLALWGCLRTDKRRECTIVNTTWKRMMNVERPTLEHIEALIASSKASANIEEAFVL